MREDGAEDDWLSENYTNLKIVFQFLKVVFILVMPTMRVK